MMLAQHWVRYGLLGHVGAFNSVDACRYPRGARVICRTHRGLELGEVLQPVSSQSPQSAGALLRGVTVEDELLLARLESHRDAAYDACCRLLRERHLPSTLMDVEHLFDGRSLYFYFWGHITPEIEEVTGELAGLYAQEIQLRRFTETLTEGCGPGCGTEQAAGGCSSGGCSTCGLAAACRPAGWSPANGGRSA
ncbi:MAG: hypothetical protein J5I93_19450 [Pirellulaceae bacterium]|nr:hypothetical protein [Pirellulaceae bacterium]